MSVPHLQLARSPFKLVFVPFVQLVTSYENWKKEGRLGTRPGGETQRLPLGLSIIRSAWKRALARSLGNSIPRLSQSGPET